MGTYIAVLAFLAAVVTVWPPEHPWGRAVWIFVFLLIMLFEVRNLYRDRASHDVAQAQAQREERESFSSIVNGITTTITNRQRQFDVSMSRFTSVLNKTGDVLKNVTGGDSYGFVVPQAISPGTSIPLLVWNEGDYPLIGATLTIARTQDPDWGMDFFRPISLGTIAPHDHIPVPSILIAPRVEPKSGQDNYWIMISAQNGTVSQSLWFREHKQIKGAWAYSYLVTRPTYEKRFVRKIYG